MGHAEWRHFRGKPQCEVSAKIVILGVVSYQMDSLLSEKNDNKFLLIRK